MIETDLAWSGISAQHKLITTGHLRPTELLDAQMARIEALDPRLNAFVTLTKERAYDDARRAEVGSSPASRTNPLRGIAIGLKDTIDTAGIRTTSGCAAFADRVPVRDAEAARLLREAGTILVGKLATHELAYGGTTNNEWLGPTRNPWDLTRIPGGSSGGSAVAVATAMCAGALGSDTCGSIRIPSALSGCVGIKPTRGLVSVEGVLPLAPELDNVGPIARKVEDATLLLGCLLQRPISAKAAEMAGMRVGVLDRYFCELLDEGVGRCFTQSIDDLARLGVLLEDVDASIPADAAEHVFVVCGAAAHDIHDPLLADHRDEIGPSVRERLEIPMPAAHELASSKDVLERISAGINSAFDGHDILIAPTVPMTAPPIGATEVPLGPATLDFELAVTRCTSPFNVAGTPVVSVPCGLAQGLPVGLQIIARRNQDEQAIAFAAAFERATPWHEARPPLASGI
ncbi:MAG: amidase [Acidimicrobiales bacterium]